VLGTGGPAHSQTRPEIQRPAPQGEVITAVLSAKQIIELTRLRDFL